MTATKRPIPKETLCRVTTGKFRGWRGVRWELENVGGVRYYSLFARYRATKHGRINADVVGLGLMLNIPEGHLKPLGCEAW